MPSFRSSPWILGAPQRGFAVARRATRALISAVTGGRPPIGRAESRVQYARERHRRQLRAAAGDTIPRGWLHLVHAPAFPTPERQLRVPPRDRVAPLLDTP